MKWFTKQELTVALVVLFLLIVGAAVKTYRTATAPDTLPAALNNE